MSWLNSGLKQQVDVGIIKLVLELCQIESCIIYARVIMTSLRDWEALLIE